MKTVNPKPLEKLNNIAETAMASLKGLLGASVFATVLILFFFGGTLYSILAGFAAAAGVVHWFEGPGIAVLILGIIFSMLALQPGAHLLLFFAAALGATYAWEWNGFLAFLVFLPGIFLIPLAFVAATALGFKALSRLRK